MFRWFRWIIGWALIIFGYICILNILMYVFADGELYYLPPFDYGHGDPSPSSFGTSTSLILRYLLFDGVIVIGSKIAGSTGNYKPTFTTPAGAIFFWIIYLAIFPIAHMFLALWKFIKFLFRLITKGPKKAFSGGANIKEDPNWNETDKQVVNEVKNICRRRSGYAETIGNGTSVTLTVTPTIFSHSITLDIKVSGKGDSRRMQSENDVESEKAELANYAERISDDIPNEIVRYIDGLSGPHDAWGVQSNASYELSFN